jgi:SAM-dependent methyltransferase
MTDDFWEKNAGNWAKVIASQTIASRKITHPAIVDAVLSTQPRSVLDMGCGEGWLTAELIKRGIPCTGIDGSSGLIKIASLHYGPYFKTVSYGEIVAGWAPDKKFDLAVFNFSLMDENLVPLLKSVSEFAHQIAIQTLYPSSQDGWNLEDFKTMTLPFDGTMPWYGRTRDSWLKLFQEAGLIASRTIETAGKTSIIFILDVVTCDDLGKEL